MVDPLRHGDRVAGVEHNDGVLIDLVDGLDQFVLAGRQIHGLHVEAFGLELGGAADHDDGDVGFGGGVGGFFLSCSRASGVSLLGSSPSMPTPRA